MKKKLIIIGGQGSGEIAMTVFEDINRYNPEWDIVGYINDVYEVGSFFGKYKIIGGSDSIVDFVNRGYYIHYTYHFNVKNKYDRVKKFESLNIPREANATGVHPLAYLNPTSKIGCGCLMLPYSSTSAGSIIDDYVHLYTGSFLGHDSHIGKYSTMAAQSILGARIKTGIGVHVGLNSSVREDIKLGSYSIIGMGSTVISDIGSYEVFAGNPAKRIR